MFLLGKEISNNRMFYTFIPDKSQYLPGQIFYIENHFIYINMHYKYSVYFHSNVDTK